MPHNPFLANYMDARRRFLTELEIVNRKLDELLDGLLEREPTVRDLALLETLHAEKHRISTGFVPVEETFVFQLLQATTARSTQTAGSPAEE